MADHGFNRLSLENRVYGYADRQCKQDAYSDRSVRSTGGGFNIGQAQKVFGESCDPSRHRGGRMREFDNEERSGAFGGRAISRDSRGQQGGDKYGGFGGQNDRQEQCRGNREGGFRDRNDRQEQFGRNHEGGFRDRNDRQEQFGRNHDGGFRDRSDRQEHFGSNHEGGFRDRNDRQEQFGRNHEGGFRDRIDRQEQFGRNNEGGFRDRNDRQAQFGRIHEGGFRDRNDRQAQFGRSHEGGFRDRNDQQEHFGRNHNGGFRDRNDQQEHFGKNQERDGDISRSFGNATRGFSNGRGEYRDNGDFGGMANRLRDSGKFEKSFGDRESNRQNSSNWPSQRIHEFTGRNTSNNKNYGGFDGPMVSFERHDRGFESIGERAPRDYMPISDDVDKLYRDDREQAEEANIEEDINVVVEFANRDIRLESWENSSLDERLKNILMNKCGYRCPRKIQAAVIPQICDGFDVIVHAETGSGKTAAFVIPILNWILMEKKKNDQKKNHQPYALVLSPTRELTEQLFNQFQKFAKGMDIHIVRSYGQMDRFKILNEIEHGVDVLCGCVGKIKDMLHRRDFNLEKMNFFVVDECDKMFNPNNKSDLDELMQSGDFPKKGSYQTLMLTATLPDFMMQQLKHYLKPDFVLCSNGAKVRANKRITQKFISASGHREKNEALFQMLLEEKKAMEKEGKKVRRTLVFVSQKKKTDMVAIDLTKKGILAASINGDRSQDQREKVVKQFREGEIQVLVGTDVCERGLDIKDLEHVINFEMPRDRDTYVHRIGRTGRVKNGVATTFVDDRDENCIRFAKELVQIVSEVDQEIPDFLQQLAENALSYHGGSSGVVRGSEGFGGFSSSGGIKSDEVKEFKSGGFKNRDSGSFGGGFGTASGFAQALVPVSLCSIPNPQTSTSIGQNSTTEFSCNTKQTVNEEVKDDANDDDW